MRERRGRDLDTRARAHTHTHTHTHQDTTGSCPGATGSESMSTASHRAPSATHLVTSSEKCVFPAGHSIRGDEKCPVESLQAPTCTCADEEVAFLNGCEVSGKVPPYAK